MKVEVIGVNPPCPRCEQTEENAKKAAEKLRKEGFDIEVAKLDISSRDTVSRFGVIMSPAIAVNGVVKMMGKVPDPGVIERMLRKEA
ncbi:hypothetical protein AC482_05360 [miscellaneous Crenarchaeota group-15 archaeon DG-45]|uniref:Thioredoxin-like fold domain-containing protein n=1 Tax=miscellaneous Crenarchaeota group-15 archaeon DG-45 TaxID=1685127 RepID=A0A0M0BND8_9ARCH|nr:MAG: hypothetical protein AC482_05360 [miscellaneous Crenarchaeota group-15 archaeon DG-45]